MECQISEFWYPISERQYQDAWYLYQGAWYRVSKLRYRQKPNIWNSDTGKTPILEVPRIQMMKCTRYVNVSHVFCLCVIGICSYHFEVSMCMYVHVSPNNISLKCLSMKSRYAHALHVFCLYLVGMCRYVILYALKIVMTVSLGCIHDHDYRGSFSASTRALDQCQYGRVNLLSPSHSR